MTSGGRWNVRRNRLSNCLSELLAAALLFGSAARAQESLDDIDKDKAAAPDATHASEVATPTPTAPATSQNGKATAEVNGYLDDRFNYGWVHTGGLVPTGDLPA